MAIEIKDGVILPYEFVISIAELLDAVNNNILEDNLPNLNNKYRQLYLDLQDTKEELLSMTIKDGIPASYTRQLVENIEVNKESNMPISESKNNICCNFCQKPLGKSVKDVYGSDYACCADCKAKGLDKTTKSIAMKNTSKAVNIDEAKKKEKWMQDAFKEETKGALHKRLHIDEDEKIPISRINKELSALKKKKDAREGQTYTKEELKFVRQLNAAKRVKELNERYYYKNTGKTAVMPHKNPLEKYYLIESPDSEWGYIVRTEDPENKSILKFNKSKELADFLNTYVFDGKDYGAALEVAKSLVDEYFEYVGPIYFTYKA